MSVEEERMKNEIPLADWMGSMPPEVTRIPLCQLRIPGSHDSGATDALNPKLPVANDEGRGIAMAGSIRWVRKGIKRWAITQRLSIRDQLLSGIRYFDLRVSHPPERLRRSIGDFHLVHALYGPMLKEVLHEIRAFLDEHPAEVVLLDVNHIFGMEGGHPHGKLKELIADALGWTALCPQMNPLECTLEFMRERGYRAVVFICGEADGLFWSQETIISRWPMTNKAKQLIGFLDDRLEDDRPFCWDRFYVHQGVLTPTMRNVVTRWTSTLEKALASSATSAISSWLQSLHTTQLSLLNVVMVDFVSSSFNSSVISLNLLVSSSSSS